MEKQITMPWMKQTINQDKLEELVREKHRLVEQLKNMSNTETTWGMTCKIRIKQINKILNT